MDGRMEKFPWLNLILLIITFFTTSIAGALQLGVDIHKTGIFEVIEKGLPFSVAIMFVLGIHEMGHYVTARRYGVRVTLPYFIPAPTLLGTFGAFIKMKSPVYSRRQLASVAFNGPLWGFLASIFVTAIGLNFSKTEVITSTRGMIELGDPLIMKLFYLFYFGNIDGKTIVLHPVAFAGWIGFFVTSLNLLPASQLDGGHIFYAVFDTLHRYVSLLVVFVLLILGIWGWGGWIIWALLIYIIGVKHPPSPFFEEEPDSRTKVIFLLALVIFILTFIPVPFKM